MRDINFFEPYSNEKNKELNIYYQIIGLAVGVMIVATFSINVCRIIILNQEIENYQSELNTQNIKENLRIAEQVSTQLDALIRYESDLDAVLESIESRDNVTNEVLKSIDSTVPINVDFKSMNINQEYIDIQAISTNRQGAAEIQHNLKNLNYIRDVHVEGISSSDGVDGEYTFNLRCYIDRGTN